MPNIEINGQRYNLKNLPENLNLNDVKDERIKKSLSIFDQDKNGILSKEEVSNVSLFYKNGYTQMEQDEGNGNIKVTDVWASRGNKNPVMMYEQNINFDTGEGTLVETRFNKDGDVSFQSTHNELNRHDDKPEGYKPWM